MKKRRFLNSTSNDSLISYTSSPQIQLIGNSQCIVDGLKNIVEYTREKITINLGKYFVSFFGDELCINSFSPEGAVVEGNIISLEFSQYD